VRKKEKKQKKSRLKQKYRVDKIAQEILFYKLEELIYTHIVCTDVLMACAIVTASSG